MSQYEMGPGGMQPPPKSGMSTGAKVLIALVIVFGGLLVLCCGGAIGLVYYGRSYVADMVSKDPATIARATHEITEIDVPDELGPSASVNMKVPFTDQEIMVCVVYEDRETGSALVLASMGDAFGPQNQTQMRRSIDQSLRQQGLGEQEDIRIEESRQIEVEIRGETVKFTLAKGVGKKSADPRILVTGVFQGNRGPVMLILNADAEKFSEEEIVAMLESIE